MSKLVQIAFLGALLSSGSAFAQDNGQPLALPAPGQPGGPPPMAVGQTAPVAPVAPPLAPARIPTYAEGVADGQNAAVSKGAPEWIAVGAGSACLASGIGCAAATIAGGVMDPTLPNPYSSDFYRSTDMERDYWNGFRQGYAQQMKKKRAVNAFIGGAAVTAVGVGIYVALLASIGGGYYY